MLILATCRLILLLGYSNHIVPSMVNVQHAVLIFSTKHVCTTWNKCERNILKLAYATHSWMLGPLLGQKLVHYLIHQQSFDAYASCLTT